MPLVSLFVRTGRQHRREIRIMRICSGDIDRSDFCGLLPYQIAKDCGLSKEPVYRFLNGERDIQFKTAVKMAEYLGLELVPRD